MTTSGQILISLAGDTLQAEERECLAHPGCAGLILFTRNYSSISQLQDLTKAVYQACSDAVIAVDQEGGRVQRFREGFAEIPAMGHFGELYAQDPEQAKQQLITTMAQVMQELGNVGVNLLLAPVLDLDRGDSRVIGQRSFSRDPNVVIALASILIDTAHAAGINITGKHFPGHGGVVADSHEELPTDTRSEPQLQEDLQPFVQLMSKLDALMPAHVCFEKLDSQPATFSSYWLQQVLRQQLGYQGVVISDDLSMQATDVVGGYPERVICALEAGCDLLSVCNNQPGAEQALQAWQDWDNATAKSASAQRIQTLIRRG